MSSISRISSLVFGLFFGFCLIVIAGLFLLDQRRQTVAPISTPSPVPSLTPLPTIPASTPTPTSVPATPTPQPDPIGSTLDLAESDITNNDFEKAYDLLLPLTDMELTEKNLARLYSDLGSLEGYEGHYKLACTYYQDQYAHQNTPDVLDILAETCYSAGLISQSATYYQDLLNWPGDEADPYRDEAKGVLSGIYYLWGTPQSEITVGP